MGNNRLQYAERDRERQDGIQYVQNSRTQGSRVPETDVRRAQGGRTQNGRPQNVRGGRTGSGREQYLWQQQQQMQQQQNVLRRKLGILSFFMCLLLLLNAVMAVSMHFRMRRMNEALKIMQSHLSLGGLDGSVEDGLASSGGQAGTGETDSAAGAGSGIRVTGQDYVNLCGLEYVDRPCQRTMEQVWERLDQLAEEDERIAEILKNSHKYPDKLLEALANNPEMTDFVMGYEENVGRVSGALTQDEMKQDFPLFLQWDPRWGYGDYGDGSNIGLAGCGPTCLSMALFYLTGNESLTPDKMAEYSMENGYYISGTGTAWALLQDVPEQYGISVSQPKAEEYTMKAALDNGSVIICSMGPGDFTAAGHFIVIYGYDKKGFLVNDPNCVARSRQSWSFSELKGQIKNIWVLGDPAKYGSVTSVADYIDSDKVYDGSK